MNESLNLQARYTEATSLLHYGYKVKRSMVCKSRVTSYSFRVFGFGPWGYRPRKERKLVIRKFAGLMNFNLRICIDPSIN